MPTTVALVRWYGGWREVTNPAGVATFGRKSALLSLGALHSTQEVDRVAGRELQSTFAKNREQMTVEHRPAVVEERPYVGYIPSSTLTAPAFDGTPTVYPTLGLAISEDEMGELKVEPTIGDIIVGIDELIDEIAKDPPRRRPRIGPVHRPRGGAPDDGSLLAF